MGTLPRIAVVAVHGVGDHEPGASAKNLAELLLRLRHDGGGGRENRFTSFRRVDLTIPVDRAHVSKSGGVGERTAAGATSTEGDFFSFRERSESLEALTRKSATDATGRATDGADHQFMREQLLRYPGSGAPYETVRHEGQRLTAGPQARPDADVHVYEMYWADLSRLGNNVLQIAYELFQLLFHLPHLGRQAVDHAVLDFPGDRVWRVYRAVHTAAVRLFTLFVPLFWITMAATILAVVPAAAPESWARILAVSFAAFGGAVLSGLAVYRLGVHWSAIPIGIAVVASATVFGLLPWLGAERALVIEWIAVSMWAVVAISKRYNRVRPGARGTGLVLALLTSVGLTALVVTTPAALVVYRIMDVFEIQIIATLAVWGLFYFSAGVSGLLGLWAARRGTDSPARNRARRAAWTGRATLAMSGTGVLLVGFPLWALLYKAFSFALPSEPGYSSSTGFFAISDVRPSEYIERVFDFAAGPGLAILLGATAVVAFLLACIVLPSVLSEVQPTGLDGSFAAAKHESHASNRLGRWLSKGLRLVKIGVDLLFVAMVAAAIANGVYWIEFAAPGWLDTGLKTLADWSTEAVLASGAWLAASLIGLAAFRGRLQSLLLGFRPVLDAALDIDTYLREHPRGGTPRARIAERYASLLRYLCRWRDSGDKGYDAIVIVAHSQGTAISADYLGFIKREPDPDLPLLLSAPQYRSQREGSDTRPDGPAMYLFTMGSPLYQLYSEAFPHLFGWVRGETGAWRQVMNDPTAGVEEIVKERISRGEPVASQFAIDARQSPSPSKLGLERWVNTYRSGDYVGRALWRAEHTDWVYCPYYGDSESYWKSPTLVISEDQARIRRELCIGHGAHTHYWDSTAVVVGGEIDQLISAAVREAPSIAHARMAGRAGP